MEGLIVKAKRNYVTYDTLPVVNVKSTESSLKNSSAGTDEDKKESWRSKVLHFKRELLNNVPPSGEIFHGRTVHDVPNKKIKEISNDYVSAFCAPPDCVLSMHRKRKAKEFKRRDVSQMTPITGIVKWNERRDFAYGMATTLYENNHTSEHCVGDPIADALGIVTVQNCCILALADGVSWGEKSKLASNCSIYGSITYICEHVRNCTYTKDIFRCILRSFENAQECIVESEATMTTLCVGVVVPLQEKEHFAFCVVNVGDSYAYVYNSDTGVKEVTHGSHPLDQVRDMRYSGGALGPADGYNPDLGNLTCSFVVVDKGDIVFLASDGISDNFDPAIAKFTPRFKAHELTSKLSAKSSSSKQLDKDQTGSSMDEYTIIRGGNNDDADGVKESSKNAANSEVLPSNRKSTNESFEEILVHVEAPPEGDGVLDPSYKRDHYGSHDILHACDCSFADVYATSSNDEDNDHSDGESKTNQKKENKLQNKHNLKFRSTGDESRSNEKDDNGSENDIKNCVNCVNLNSKDSVQDETGLGNYSEEVNSSDHDSLQAKKKSKQGIRLSLSDNDIKSLPREGKRQPVSDDKTRVNELNSVQPKGKNSFIRRMHSQPAETIGGSDRCDGKRSNEIIIPTLTPTLTPRERHQGALEQMTQIIKAVGVEPIQGTTISAMDVCARLMTFVVNRTAEKREILEEAAPTHRKDYKAKISKKLEGVPGKLDHAAIVAYEVGIHGKESVKPVHTHAKNKAELPSTELTANVRLAEQRRASEPVERADKELFDNPQDRKQFSFR